MSRSGRSTPRRPPPAALDAIRSAERYGVGQGRVTTGLARLLRCRRPRPDNAWALSLADVDRLLTRDDIPLRERTFWRMTYETAARSAELLALDVEGLNVANQYARSGARAARPGGTGASLYPCGHG